MYFIRLGSFKTQLLKLAGFLIVANAREEDLMHDIMIEEIDK
ncbi:MAG: hypothetical protein ACMUEM_02325 [Flavobacteriales bacterium AspAUS03]